jgi:hypothetical protein
MSRIFDFSFSFLRMIRMIQQQELMQRAQINQIRQVTATKNPNDNHRHR